MKRPRHRWTSWPTIALASAACVAAVSGACRSRSADQSEPVSGEARLAVEAVTQDDPPAAPLPRLPMGKPDLAGYAYSVGSGREAFRDAMAAIEGADQAAALRALRAALGADAGHLEAHWHLALALAGSGDHEQAAGHLSAAVAGDFLRWGDESLTAPALADLRDSAIGRPYVELVARYRERFRQIVAAGVIVIGRRGKPWYPQRSGHGLVNHRSEIYAFDPETRRFVRVSRTNGGLVGYLHAPGQRALVYVSYRKVWTPAPDQDDEPYLREVDVGWIELDRPDARDEHALSGREVRLTSVAELWLGYEQRGGRAELVARVRSPRTGDAAPEQRTYVLDHQPPRARQVSEPDPGGAGEPAALQGDRLHVTYDAVERLRLPIEGVIADWDDTGAAGAFLLERTRKTITLDHGALAYGHSMVWSPAETRLAFTTLGADLDEDCAAAARSVSLIVVDAATGRLQELATGEPPLAPMWLDERRLAYMERRGPLSTVRVIDASTGEALHHITGAAGVGTDRVVGRHVPAAPCAPGAALGP